MTDLIPDLLAAIDEAEHAARKATEGPWRTGAKGVWCGPMDRDWVAGCDPNDARHIALNGDPQRVVALCQAHRRIVEEWQATVHNPYEGKTDDELHQLQMHPRYEYATTEGQRKAWDYADEPPYRRGEGWELNITSRNPDAFERFDYHEERYWRRRLPEGEGFDPGDWRPMIPSYIRHLASGYGLTEEGA